MAAGPRISPTAPAERTGVEIDNASRHNARSRLIIPADENSWIDEESLRNLVEFNLEAGAQELGVALASEVFKLSGAEHDQVTWVVVDQEGDEYANTTVT